MCPSSARFVKLAYTGGKGAQLKNLFLTCLCPFLFCASVLLVSSCGDENTDLKITVTPNRTFFLPGSIIFSSDSCYEDTTLSDPRFQIDTFETEWNGEGTFQPILIKIEITGSGNVATYSCSVTGKSSSSLGAFLGFGGTTISSGSTKTSSCAIHCGDVSITALGTDFTVSGRIELIGIQTKTDGTQVPRSKSTTISLQNAL